MMDDEKQKVVFRDLSWPVKVAVIAAWAVGALYALSFMVGFILGIIGW